MNYKVIGSDLKEYGPISADQVRQWLRERRLNSMSLAQAEGSPDWKPLSLVPEFAGTMATPPPPTAPVAMAFQPVVGLYPRTNSMAVWGLIMGLLACLCGCCCYGFPFNLLGLVFSCIALSQISQNPHFEQGRSLAIAGLVLSLFATVAAFFGGLMGLLFALAGHSRTHTFKL